MNKSDRRINAPSNCAQYIAGRFRIRENAPQRLGAQGGRDRTRVALRVRSMYFPDPERCPEPVEGGNLLEFVCYDASVG